MAAEIGRPTAPPPASTPGPRPATPLVIDTNVALDLLVFSDPALQAVRQGLADGSLQWQATAAMRDELARVLHYPRLLPRLAQQARSAQEVMDVFDRCSQQVPAAPRAPLRCQDPDDQIFIDLAFALRCPLLSKDRQVLRLRRRLVPWGITVCMPDQIPSPW